MRHLGEVCYCSNELFILCFCLSKTAKDFISILKLFSNTKLTVRLVYATHI